MLIDTHAHIYHERFDGEIAATIARARDEGVEIIIMPAIDVSSIHRAIELSKTHEGLYAMAALHPSETAAASDSDFEEVRRLAQHPKVIAIGESGLDYYWDRSFDERQQDFFRRHIRLAVEADMPLILHNREATHDILRILEEERSRLPNPSKLRGILHCFVDDARTARRAAEIGFLVGIGGIVTFKNSNLDDVVRELPLDQIVLETDAPFLAPDPYRGKRNEPAYVRIVAEKVARIRGMSLEEVARITSQNARRIFGLEPAGRD